MVNPGSFPGSRGEFINAQSTLYAEAVRDGHIADTVADIQRRYLKRFPITLADDEEPSQEWLAQVNDDTPDDELSPPELSKLDTEAGNRAMEEYTTKVSRIKFKKDQIRRRLHYIYTKNRDTASDFDKALKDPIANITSKLLGVELKLPRKRTPYNIWAPKHRTLLDPLVDAKIKELGAKKDQYAAIRSAVYKEQFEALSAAEREKWVQITEKEHEKAVADAKKGFKDSIPSSPIDRQRVISSLPKFIEPILDAVAEYTGWKATFIAGGPEPADGGRLNMISIHSGLTLGSVKMDFGRAQKSAYKKHIAPSFGSFLKKCYTIQECRAVALPKDHNMISISDLSSDEDINMQVHTFDSDAEHEGAHKPKRLFEEELPKKGNSSKPPHPLPATPSSLLRFGPPLGKKKNRIPPTKNAADVKLGPSPLSLYSVVADPGPTPEPSVLSSDSASGLHAAVTNASHSAGTSAVGSGSASMPSLPASNSVVFDAPAAATGNTLSSSASYEHIVTDAPSPTPTELVKSSPASPASSERAVVNAPSPTPTELVESRPGSPASSERAVVDAPSPTPTELVESNPASPASSEHIVVDAPSPAPTEHIILDAPSPAPTEYIVADAPSPAPTEHIVVDAPSPAPTEHIVVDAPSPAPTEAIHDNHLSPAPGAEHIAVDAPSPAPAEAMLVDIPSSIPMSGSVVVDVVTAESSEHMVVDETSTQAAVASTSALSNVQVADVLYAEPIAVDAPSPTSTDIDNNNNDVGSSASDMQIIVDAPLTAAQSGLIYVNKLPPASSFAHVVVDRSSPMDVRMESNSSVTSTPPPTPPTRRGSLPPSPRASPEHRYPLGGFSGAATVPNLEEMEVSPVKRGKRKAGPSGKENNSKERASKRQKKTSAPRAGGSQARRASAVNTTPLRLAPQAATGESLSVPVPPGAPAWLQNALAVLASQELGDRWVVLLEAWLAFERPYNYAKESKPPLPTSSRRHASIGEWIKYARSPRYRPSVQDWPSYGRSFNSWWYDLQPKWRRGKGEALLRGHGSWEAIRCAGLNGIFSALAGLFFWGEQAYTTSCRPAWDAAVEDVIYVLESMVQDA